MALAPLQQWFCDACGEIIERPEDGWVHWRRDDDGRVHSFEIVHHLKASPRKGERGCYPAELELDMHLHDMIGPRGVVDMLAIVDVGRFHDAMGSSVGKADLRNWAETFRRLQLPYYEEARRHFATARSDGRLEGVNEVALYMEETLKSIVDEYAE